MFAGDFGVFVEAPTCVAPEILVRERPLGVVDYYERGADVCQFLALRVLLDDGSPARFRTHPLPYPPRKLLRWREVARLGPFIPLPIAYYGKRSEHRHPLQVCR